MRFKALKKGQTVKGFTLSAVLLSACADYSFKVNDRVIYTPEPLFEGYSLEDERLSECVKQTIKDQTVTAAAQLEELNCAHAGIASLAGLEIFSGLQRLRLSHNNIEDLTPLFDLPLLSVLQLDGNAELSCQDINSLERQLTLKVDPPEHCR